MTEKTFTVTNRLGLHARPASLFVQIGAKLKSSVQVTKEQGGERIVVNGKSVMGLMMLAAAHGEKLKITIEGPDEKEALKRFEDLFASKFNED